MKAPSHIQKSLVDVDDSVLVLIDIQDHFLKKYNQVKSQNLVDKVSWLLNVAKHLGVPVVAMAEAIETNGPLNQKIQDSLPINNKVYDKDFFGIAGNSEILAAVAATGRKTAICVGVETDVCVAQSAIGLIGEGYNVLTLQDAVASLDADEEIGLGRMRDAGVAISSVKALYYEWLRSVTKTVDLGVKAPELETTLRPVNLKL